MVTSHPTLSVVIPVYNATGYLRQCLAALAASSYDDFDVLVVDDGSTTRVEPLVTSHGFGYLRLDGPGGPARARNLGVIRVSGQYVVFIDADVCVHHDTLARMAEILTAEPSLDAVIGTYDNAPAASNFLSQYKNLLHHYTHQSCAGDIRTFWSGCGAMRRDLFLAWGGFDDQRYRRPAIEDIELGTWLSAAGHRIILDPRVRAKHLKCWTFWRLLKADIVDRGIPWISLMWRARALANTLNVQPTQRYSVALVYLAVLLLLMTPWWWGAWGGVIGMILVVVVLNIDFYRYLAVRRGLGFTLRVLPLHWLYFGYCGVCVVWGTLRYWLLDAGSRPQSPSPDKAI